MNQRRKARKLNEATDNFRADIRRKRVSINTVISKFFLSPWMIDVARREKKCSEGGSTIRSPAAFSPSVPLFRAPLFYTGRRNGNSYSPVLEVLC